MRPSHRPSSIQTRRRMVCKKIPPTIEKILNFRVPMKEIRRSLYRWIEERKRRRSQSIIELGSRNRSKGNIVIEPIMPSSTHKLSPALEEMISAIREGLESGKSPIKVSEGTGGVYFLPNAKGNIIGVFKPLDEEPFAENNPKNYTMREGTKKGIKVGEGGYREVATYILDHPLKGPRKNGDDEIGFAGVPPTMLVRCSHMVFHNKCGVKEVKLGSLQKYVKNAYNCDDMGTGKIPVDQVHMISVLDIRLANADRHGGNILYLEKADSPVRLVPIDHGYCLHSFEDITLEWIYWPQGGKPYSPETVKYIESLNAEKDIEMLKLHKLNISPESCLVLRISTMLLKKGAAAGLTPNEIASILCKDTIDAEAADIEYILEEAERATPRGSSESIFLRSVSIKIDSYISRLRQ